MAIKMTCPCGKRMAIDKQYIGRKIACPGCGKRFTLDRAKLVAMAKRSRHAAATEAVHADASTPSSSMPASLDDELLGGQEGQAEDLLGLLDDDAINAQIESVQRPHPSLARGGSRLDRDMLQEGADAPQTGERPTCPSCKQSLPPNAKLCIQCGINIKSGRGIVTATDGHLDTAYDATETTLKALSLIMWLGFMPIASEAFGTRKTHSVRAIAVVTILTSIAFWCFAWSSPEKIMSVRNLPMWCGKAEAEPGYLYELYEQGQMGDSAAFHSELEKAIVRRTHATSRPTVTEKEATDSDSDAGHSDAVDKSTESNETKWTPDEIKTIIEPSIVEAHNSLEPDQQTVGQFHIYQLLTNAFLHGGMAANSPLNLGLIWGSLTHLVGNLIFLIVFGSGVNALLGNRWTAPIYLLLAIIASAVYFSSARNEPPHYALGASGAIMGMAGMYLVFFPTQRVHMAAWIRFIIPLGFIIRIGPLHLKIFAIRGFWVVLFYIAFDVFYTWLGIQDGTAHWAHLGGFIGGFCIALVMLVSRLVNVHGTDIVSMILGKRAWAIVGKPRA